MEKYLIPLFFIFGTTSVAASEYGFPAQCVSESILEKTINEFEESPLASGISIRTTKKEDFSIPMVIFVNKVTRTFTVVEKLADNKYCVVIMGAEFTPLAEDGKILK